MPFYRPITSAVGRVFLSLVIVIPALQLIPPSPNCYGITLTHYIITVVKHLLCFIQNLKTLNTTFC